MSAALKLLKEVLHSRGQHAAANMAIQRAVASHLAGFDLDRKRLLAVVLNRSLIHSSIATNDTQLPSEPIMPSTKVASAVGPIGRIPSV